MGAAGGRRVHRGYLGGLNVVADTDKAANVERLFLELRRALRHGARAGQLLTYSPAIIDLLCPVTESAWLGASISVRAMKAEELIRRGIAEIGGRGAEALLIVLGLKPGTLDQKLIRRRESAARALSLQPVTFRSARHEKQLLMNLAIEVCRILANDQA